MECFGLSSLRMLPTVAFFYRCISLYIDRGQVLFQNLLLVIAPSIRGRSEGMFCFQLFGVTCLSAEQYLLAVFSVNFFFVFMSNPMVPLLYGFYFGFLKIRHCRKYQLPTMPYWCV